MNQTIFHDICELIADIMDLEDNAPDVHNNHLCANEAWTLLRKMVEVKCKEVYEDWASPSKKVLDCVNGVMKCGFIWDIEFNEVFDSYDDIYDFFFIGEKHEDNG